MNHHREFFPSRSAIVLASIAVTIFASAPILAQQKPIVIEPNVIGDAATKAISVISKPGSYSLSRNIVNGRAGFDSVLVTASDVTIDLMGLSIISTVSTTGAGINATGQSNVVIRDGIITGCGGPAIIAGSNANISAITASGNSNAAGAGASIQAGNGSQIVSNTVTGSEAGGISCGVGCFARNNVLQGNTGFGINFLDDTGGYLGNVLQGNDGNTAGTTGQVSGGASLGQNLCNGVAC
jgi:hypothetical protein